MGEPSALSKGQIEILREAAQPSITSERKLVKNETLQLTFDIAEFGVTYFEASPISGISDRGFKYKDI